ncbi:MAG: hypothetical protein AMXMBFR81_05220 [Chthonomonas sp.]
MPKQTVFESKRGVSRVEVREGYSQVLFSGLPEPLVASRVAVLEVIAQAGVSIDFLKLTQSGLSFLVPEAKSEQVEAAIRSIGYRYEVLQHRAIVLAHAVNMRDEEGLIARIVGTAIRCGVQIDHIGDMHDRVLMVVSDFDVPRLQEAIAPIAAGGRP